MGRPGCDRWSPQQSEKKQEEQDGHHMGHHMVPKRDSGGLCQVGNMARRYGLVREALEIYKVLLCSEKGPKFSPGKKVSNTANIVGLSYKN